MKQPDYTFWTRLLRFTEDIEIRDFAGYEELEYIKHVTKQQLRGQYDYATGEELEYLDRMNTINKIN